MKQIEEVYLAKIENQRTRSVIRKLSRGSYDKVVSAYRQASKAMKPGEMVCMYRIDEGVEVLLRSRALGRTYSETRSLMSYHGGYRTCAA